MRAQRRLDAPDARAGAPSPAKAASGAVGEAPARLLKTSGAGPPGPARVPLAAGEARLRRMIPSHDLDLRDPAACEAYLPESRRREAALGLR